MREPVVLEAASEPGDPLTTVNTDEALVPGYELPDPLRFEDGRRVTADDWPTRRSEILAMFEDHVYGRTPTTPIETHAIRREGGASTHARADRSQTRLTVVTERGSVSIDLLLLLPSDARGPAPVFLVPNFDGNHTVSDDPAIEISAGVTRDCGEDAAPRGSKAHRFPVETIIGRGNGLATFYAADTDRDIDDGFVDGAQPLFYRDGQSAPAPYEWGTIAAWAWGCSRVLDHLTTLPTVDAGRVTVGGHSRLGKTALWAAARDERFAAAFGNDSGCTGAALSRRRFGENVAVINALFPRHRRSSSRVRPRRRNDHPPRSSRWPRPPHRGLGPLPRSRRSDRLSAFALSAPSGTGCRSR